MGILDRLFRDPERDLERARSLLARGRPQRALELAARALRTASSGQRQRARELASQARAAVVERDLQRAARAEASELYDDAAEWVRSALDHADAGDHRTELEARVESLLARAREAEAEEPFELRAFAGDEAGPAVAGEGSAEDLFHALIGTLRDEIAGLYGDRPPAFRQAFVDLHDGRARRALKTLEELVASDPEDPVARLERGRCRLACDDATGARADFEAVWETWGDEPLDLAAQTSVAALWAEASLMEGSPAAVIERLAELAEPARGRADVVRPYAVALLEAGRFEEASDFLAVAVPRFPADQDLPYLLARARGRLGDRDGAVACLESAVAPSCGGGSCNKPPLHLPSLRALTALHLEDEDGLPRARELLTHLARAAGGRPTAEDHLLLARYHQLDGHPEAAAEARAAAERLGGGRT